MPPKRTLWCAAKPLTRPAESSELASGGFRKPAVTFSKMQTALFLLSPCLGGKSS